MAARSDDAPIALLRGINLGKRRIRTYIASGNVVYRASARLAARIPDLVGAGSKLTNAWFDARLDTISTARNWRTVLKLQEMARGLADGPASKS